MHEVNVCYSIVLLNANLVQAIDNNCTIQHIDNFRQLDHTISLAIAIANTYGLLFVYVCVVCACVCALCVCVCVCV